MSAPVHFEVETFYECAVGPACGYDAPGRLTDDHTQVTCRKCLTLCGFEAAPLEQLTECRADPLRKAA